MTGPDSTAPHRILIVQPHGEWGGPGALLQLLIEQMDERRYRPWVAVRAGSEVARRYAFLGPRLVPVEGLRTIPRSLSPPIMGRYVRDTARMGARLARVIRARGLELVHSWTESVWVGGVAARLAGVPATSSSIGSTTFHPPLVGWGLAQLLRLLSDRILSCQETNRRTYRGFGVPGTHLRIVYNSVDTRRFQPPPQRPTNSPPRLVMVAGLYPIKGHQDFIEALGVLRAQGSRFSAQLIGPLEGNPEYLAHLRRRLDELDLKGCAELTGFMEHDQLARTLGEIDLFVLPSRFEALSGACLEAMAMGLPVVATRVGGNEEAVIDGENGLTVPARDPRALADAIDALLQDPARRKAMGAASRERAVCLFDVRSSLSSLMAAYDELLATG